MCSDLVTAAPFVQVQCAIVDPIVEEILFMKDGIVV